MHVNCMERHALSMAACMRDIELKIMSGTYNIVIIFSWVFEETGQIGG